MKTILSLLLLAVSTGALAEDWKLDLELHGLSKHFDARCGDCYNERNYGAGYAFTKSGKGVVFGQYLNSFYKEAAYLAFTQQTNIFEVIAIGYELGIVSGYGPGISPMVVPKVQIQAFKHLAFNFRVLPAIKDITPAVASISIVIRLP